MAVTLGIQRSGIHSRVVSFTLGQIAHHTLVVAASGSGKSYLLGRLIEELVLEGEARAVVLDPNADHLHISKVQNSLWCDRALVRHLAPGDTRTRFEQHWGNVRIEAVSNNRLETAARPPRIRWRELSPRRMLEYLYPGEDEPLASEFLSLSRGLALQYFGEEYTTRDFLQIVDGMGAWCQVGVTDYAEISVVPLLTDPPDSVLHGLLSYIARVRRLFSLDVWADASNAVSIGDLVQDEDIGILELDLQSSLTAEERSYVVHRALGSLWDHCRKRAECLGCHNSHFADDRKMHFIIIDEAHNWVPVQARDEPLKWISRQIRTIAAEGRKLGVFLVLSTQRPRKLHPDLVSECDNVFLMRMPNRADMEYIADSIGHGADRLQRCRRFGIGDVLFLSALSPRIREFHASPRRTVHGGSGIASM